jgi:hypothetical protein
MLISETTEPIRKETLLNSSLNGPLQDACFCVNPKSNMWITTTAGV